MFMTTPITGTDVLQEEKEREFYFIRKLNESNDKIEFLNTINIQSYILPHILTETFILKLKRLANNAEELKQIISEDANINIAQSSPSPVEEAPTEVSEIPIELEPTDIDPELETMDDLTTPEEIEGGIDVINTSSPEEKKEEPEEKKEEPEEKKEEPEEKKEEPEEKKEEPEEKEIETSKEGIGILPLIGEIQDKLAAGNPSEVELAALKALKKLVD